MTDEFCPRLFAKFIISLLLWQLGHEFKFQTTAQSTDDPQLPPEEETALKSVADSLGLELPNKYCADVFEIYCDCRYNNNTICHIRRLSWQSKRLNGYLSEAVVNLTHLEKLDLSYNQIQGGIPAILGNMSRLYSLDLSNNQLTGFIPSSLGNLKAQVIFNNHLYSCRPMYQGGDRKGKDTAPRNSKANNACHQSPPSPCPYFNLELSNNHLEGSIPDTLGSIKVDPTNLKGQKLEQDETCDGFSISLHDNHLTGSIPKTFGKLNFLTTLDLRNNLLTGAIPPSMGDLSLLDSLYLSENLLEGSLPTELGKLTSLRDLFLQSNNFTGHLPETFAQLKNLSSFSISGNYLSGPFPNFITNWIDIEFLSLYGNNFRGNITPEIFNLSRLDTLEISDVGANSFQFPPSAELNQITTLVLRSCSITGPIPPYIGNFSSLQYLDLSFNNLTEKIPGSLANINLTYMSFAENGLTGPIPAWIFRASTWTKIDLSYNDFSSANKFFRHPNLNLFSCCRSCNASCTPAMRGADQLNTKYCLPDGKPKYHSLYINCGGEDTKIDGNHYGHDNSTLFPYGVGPKDQNWAFSSSGSFLTTTSNSSDNIKKAKCGIPVADAPLYSKARLAPVSLKYYGFCLLNGSYNVTLHFAEIVYTGDDSEHSDLKKRIFDVYIQKEMVRRNFHINSTENINELEKVALIENHTTKVENGMLEIHLYWAGKGSSGDSPDYNGPLLSAISVTPDFKIGGDQKLSGSAIAMITLSSITVALALSLAFAWIMGWLEKEVLHDIKVGDEKTVTLKQLIVATRGFSKDVEIGKGGFGTVFRAELPDQSIVAVKKISTLSDEGIQKLNIGVYNLQNLRHDNLVRLFDIHVGKDSCFLVYEYMENKSLADALFDPEHRIKLNWDSRYNICVGIAKGLQYLHEHPRLKMVHWGIKAANILLDAKLKPKISDLGLASASVENDNEASHFLWMMKTEASTGYMAPEYPAIGKKSGYKYDVYSFGVVMLEIVCGRKNVGAGHKNKQELVLLVDEVCVADSNGKLPNLVDESLSAYDTKQAMTILKLAMKCTHISPGVRPTMYQVVSVLADGRPLDDISTPAPKEDHEKTEDSLNDLSKDADRSAFCF